MNTLNFSLIEQGGPVMWILLVVSLFGFIIFVERTLFLHRGQIRTSQYMEGIRNLLQKGRRLEALTLCEDVPGPIPGVVKAILLHADSSEKRMRLAAEEAALVEIPTLERRIGAVAAISRIAPLLGLLGTVLGVIQAFYPLPETGAVGYPSFGLLLGGIGQALLTTAFGLMIAIMAHIAHHFLHGRVRALVHDMEYAGHELIQFIQKEAENLPLDASPSSEE